jgi:glutathione S-transferase
MRLKDKVAIRNRCRLGNRQKLLQELNDLLAGGEWVLGSPYSVANPYTLVIYGWGKLHGLPLDRLKNYTAFKNRMLRRPAVRKVLEREQSRLLQA